MPALSKRLGPAARISFVAGWVALSGAAAMLPQTGTGLAAEMISYSLVIPVLTAVFFFGRLGGLLTALAAGLACLATALAQPGGLSPLPAQRVLYQMAVFIVAALVASRLSERLREARNRYLELFDQAPLGMYRLDPDGRFLEANQALVEMLGVESRQELLDSNARDLFVHQGDLRRWWRGARDGGALDFETQLRRPDGGILWVRDCNRAVLGPDGSIRCFEGTVEDIGQRRHSQAISALLYDITEAVAQTRDLPHLYRSIHQSLKRYVDADNFFIALANQAADRLDFVYFEDEREDAFYDITSLNEPGVFSLTLETIRTGRPMFVTREQIDAMAAARGLPGIGVRCQVWLGVPLRVKNTVLGCMAVQHYSDPNHYTGRDVDLMVSVSEQVALAIERKMDADALAAGEEKYRTIFENALEGIFQCAPDGLFIGANPAMARILGHDDPSGLVDGRTSLGDLYLDPLDETRDVMRVVLESGWARDMELRLRCRDGQAIWVAMSARLVRSPAGVPHVVGWAQDITERRRAQEDLAAANARNRDIIDFLPDATMVVDADRRLIAWNKAMEEMTGVPKQDILGRGDGAYAVPFYGRTRPVLLDLFWEDDETLRRSYDFVVRRDKTLVAETWVPKVMGGRGATVWAAASPLFDGDGNMVGAIESVRDVTVRKQAEEALRRAHDELERRVEERTRELRLANLRLRELDEMKTEFLSSASHELRTPLTSVLGFVKLISKSFRRGFLPLAHGDKGLERRARRILENLEIIALEGDRLTRLVNDLLDLNKIESGRMDWRDGLVDMADMVRRTVTAVGGQFEDLTGVDLRLEVDEGLPLVLADPDRIQQVLLNLLSNAAKFTEQGFVLVAARAVDKDGVRVTVRDTGPGVVPGDAERIFGKFYQVPAGAGQGKTRGTGLGLTICREIVEHYHGRIWVEPAPGRGSVFMFELPAHRG